MFPGFPKNRIELEEHFRTQDQCLEYLFKLRWPEEFICPKCGHEKFWSTNRDRYICAKCRHQASVTAGTIFHRTRKPLTLWFRAIWYITTHKHGGRDSEEAVGEDPSPLCHRVISLLKRSLLNPYQIAVHPAQLDRYLEEFAFRFNRRKSKSRGLLFLRLLQHAVRIPPFPAKEIQLGLRDYMRGTRKNKIVPSRDVFRPVDTAFLDQLGDLPF